MGVRDIVRAIKCIEEQCKSSVVDETIQGAKIEMDYEKFYNGIAGLVEVVDEITRLSGGSISSKI